MGKVPWVLVIDRAPAILEKSKALLYKLKKGEAKENLEQEMAQIIDEQGQLIETLSAQNEQLLKAVRRLAFRQQILGAAVVVSLLLASAGLYLLLT